ncbi:hypothetical protein ACPOL_1802 [Acidisarcina polymorpha]|uniref:Uncharacterized protein n=1 Tax=Acidisarcina polymorpha TaxID=2211140 RepID=A0A2Z5FXA7_9BACT|nr:hypothetical protein ACPOL_1802 [Acidisarcina polymorpha]
MLVSGFLYQLFRIGHSKRGFGLTVAKQVKAKSRGLWRKLFL